MSKYSNSWIFQKRCFMKIIWHRISTQTLLFQDVFAYSSKWRHLAKCYCYLAKCLPSRITKFECGKIFLWYLLREIFLRLKTIHGKPKHTTLLFLYHPKIRLIIITFKKANFNRLTVLKTTIASFQSKANRVINILPFLLHVCIYTGYINESFHQ